MALVRKGLSGPCSLYWTLKEMAPWAVSHEEGVASLDFATGLVPWENLVLGGRMVAY